MKKTLAMKQLPPIVLICLALGFTGCTQLDGMNASKGEKTAMAAGLGGLAGNVLARVTGADSRMLTLFGAAVAGFAEYQHETNRELESARKQAAEMKTAGIDAEVKQKTVKVKDEKGVEQTTTALESFSVKSTAPTAVKAVAETAQASKFGGRIVVVAPASEKARIAGSIKSMVNRPEVTTTYISPAYAAKHGVKNGVAWVPSHGTQMAAKKGGSNV